MYMYSKAIDGSGHSPKATEGCIRTTVLANLPTSSSPREARAQGQELALSMAGFGMVSADQGCFCHTLGQLEPALSEVRHEARM